MFEVLLEAVLADQVDHVKEMLSKHKPHIREMFKMIAKAKSLPMLKLLMSTDNISWNTILLLLTDIDWTDPVRHDDELVEYVLQHRSDQWLGNYVIFFAQLGDLSSVKMYPKSVKSYMAALRVAAEHNAPDIYRYLLGDEPTDEAYSAVLSGLAWRGDLDNLNKLLEEVASPEVLRWDVILSAAIDGQIFEELWPRVRKYRPFINMTFEKALLTHLDDDLPELFERLLFSLFLERLSLLYRERPRLLRRIIEALKRHDFYPDFTAAAAKRTSLFE